MPQPFLVVGNLKMNLLSREEATQYLDVLRREMRERRYAHARGVLCPPFPYLPQFDRLPAGWHKGAQNLFPEKSGAYTGEVSPLMLKNEGVEYVLVGHSERRQYAGETDELVRAKVLAAIKHHLVPIACIGETFEEHRVSETAAALSAQVQTIFSGLSKAQAEKVIVAYEPRYAIGTDILPSTQELLQVRVLLLKILTERFDVQTAKRIAVLYGGSVKSTFVPQVSWEAQMDGVLVGRESLFPYELVKMMGLFEAAAKRQGTQKA